MLGGRYRLVAPIARGGMAEVWEAHDEVLARPVAVKILQAHLAVDGLFLERFRREAVTAARVAHPGVVATYDTGVDEGTAYIVMELVPGGTLRQALHDHGRFDPRLAVDVTRQIADALVHAHRAGLIHRDIKPANVLLVEDEWSAPRAKITDFGIAKAGAGIGRDLTRTGTVLGTPKYLSPEQIRGAEPDARADLYAVGVLLYEMLAGQPPFAAGTDMATAMAHLHDRVPKLSERAPGVRPDLEQLVYDLLAKDPERRVPSALALRQRLDALAPLPASPPAAAPHGPRIRRLLAARPPVSDPPGSRLPAAVRAPGGRGPMEREAGPGLGAVPSTAATTVLGGPGSWPASGATPELAEGVGPGARPGPRPDGGAADTDADLADGPRTDELAAPEAPFLRASRIPGAIALGLLLAGALVATTLVLGHGTRPRGAPQQSATTPSVPVSIESVSVFMPKDRPPDDPQGTRLTYDGNPSTAWYTAQYHSPLFGGLYNGLGLAIQLRSSGVLHRLAVTSPSAGWSAQTYVSSRAISSPQPVTAWGAPTDSKSAISGDATFSLGGRRGRWVLLWLTNLGPADQVSIAELSVS